MKCSNCASEAFTCAGCGVQAEPWEFAPAGETLVASRERVEQVVAEYIDDLDGVTPMGTPAEHLDRRAKHVTDALLAAGVFRDEAAEADGEWDPVNNRWKVPPTTRNYPGAEPAGVSDEALLNQFIDNGKRIVREEQGDDHTPTTAEVERFIPPDLRRKFWERYVGKYFDQALINGG